MVQIFIVFFVKNDGYKKIIGLGANPKLRKITNQTANKIQNLNIQNPNFE